MVFHFFGYYATFWLTDRPSVDPVTIRPREGAQNGQKLSKNSLKPRSPVNSCRNQKVPLEKLTEKQIYTELCTGVQWGTLKQFFDPRSKVATF